MLKQGLGYRVGFPQTRWVYAPPFSTPSSCGSRQEPPNWELALLRRARKLASALRQLKVPHLALTSLSGRVQPEALMLRLPDKASVPLVAFGMLQAL